MRLYSTNHDAIQFLFRCKDRNSNITLPLVENI